MQLAFEFFNLRQMDQEKSPRTQLCVKRVVLERREFTVGLRTVLYRYIDSDIVTGIRR